MKSRRRPAVHHQQAPIAAEDEVSDAVELRQRSGAVWRLVATRSRLRTTQEKTEGAVRSDGSNAGATDSTAGATRLAHIERPVMRHHESGDSREAGIARLRLVGVCAVARADEETNAAIGLNAAHHVVAVRVAGVVTSDVERAVDSLSQIVWSAAKGDALRRLGLPGRAARETSAGHRHQHAILDTTQRRAEGLVLSHEVEVAIGAEEDV